MMYWIAFGSFALFFLSDLNDRFFHRKALKVLFPTGALGLVAATAVMVARGRAYLPLAARLPLMLAAFVCLLWMTKALFFSIPATESYARPGEARAVCTTGVYALCRHPGVLFFIMAYLLLCPAFGMELCFALLCSALNVALALFEDVLIFPVLLRGYPAYKKATPFLIPTRSSIKKARGGGARA